MENKLEKLFNSLIEKGWRIENPKARIGDVKYMYGLRELRIVYETDRRDAVRQYPIRFLVSKESGLWQFCMSKGFTPNVSCYRWEKWFYDIDDLTQCEADVSGFDNYGYRLIESALCDEDKLEEFLLSNIKIDG